MMFSARSLSLASRARQRAASSSSVLPRGQVPLMGLLSTRLLRMCRKRSGEAEATDQLPYWAEGGEGGGALAAQATVEGEVVVGLRQPEGEALGEVGLEDVAFEDVVDDGFDLFAVLVGVKLPAISFGFCGGCFGGRGRGGQSPFASGRGGFGVAATGGGGFCRAGRC